jgi:hypothetical protein
MDVCSKNGHASHCRFTMILGMSLASALFSNLGRATTFQLFDGAIAGSFDSTLSYGIQVRTEKPDYDLGIPPASPLPKAALILNDGRYGQRHLFNKKWDIVANTVKASHDLSLTGDEWNAFIRGNYFYDFELAGQPLPDAADNRLVKHGDLTDAYVGLKLGSARNINLRLGKQVISWGESTFIGGSLNDVNTVDLAKLRQPGVELKDALLGTPAIDVSWVVSPVVSIEAFALADFDEVHTDPMGSFWGTSDATSDGGGFANARDNLNRLVCLAPDGGICHLAAPGGVPVTRSGDRLPSGKGQFGVATRFYAPNLGNGFDFGIYYEKLDDHNPQLSARAGSLARPGYYFVTYAKNVERYGASFNTTIGPWAVGGEYSYRRNAPIQGAGFLFVGARGRDLAGRAYQEGDTYEGFERYKRHQLQLTGQRLWGPMPEFRADQWNTIGEVAYGWVADVPGHDVNGHAYPGTPIVPDASGFARFDDITRDFWGLQARSVLTYNNLLLNKINVEFSQSLRWDVEGVSPEFGGNLFVGGRKSVSLGLAFDYRQAWRLDVSQTLFFGGEDQFRPARSRNVSTTDHDFFSLNVSYSF